MKNYLLDAAKILSETITGERFYNSAFEDWLKSFTTKKDDFYLYHPHNNYPYSKEQLYKIYKNL